MLNVVGEFLGSLKRLNVRGLLVLCGDFRKSILSLSRLSLTRTLYVPGYGHISREILDYAKVVLKEFTFLNSPNDVFYRLGEEYDHVVIEVYDSFRPNVVIAASEMVKSGGTVTLIANEWEKWNPTMKNINSQGYFAKYLKNALFKSKSILIFNVDRETPIHYNIPSRPLVKPKVKLKIPPRPKSNIKLLQLCRTQEQVELLEEVVDFLHSKDRVLIIKGDRGRGKSSALGLAIAQALLSRRFGYITVTAPSSESVQALMRMLYRSLKTLRVSFKPIMRNDEYYGFISSWFKVEYKPPPLVDKGMLTVIDEATAISSARVKRIAWSSRKTLIASTIHGYEGTGHVLEHILLKQLPTYRMLEFKTPIRYHVGDPLEEWLYETFLLNVEPKSVELTDAITYKSLDKRLLAEDYNVLKDVYSLLVIAHYRNEPDDLLILLDSKHHEIKVLLNENGDVIAVAQCVIEDCSNIDIKDLIEDRVKGIMITNKLVKYGCEELAKFKGVRIVRITVNPNIQRRGVGSKLLSEIENEYKSKGVDWVGAIFSRNEVLPFWVKNGYITFYISPRFNKVTGEKNLAVIKPLNDMFKALLKSPLCTFKSRFLLSLANIYRDLQAEIATYILRSTDGYACSSEFKIHNNDVYRLSMFLNGTLLHESVIDLIYKILYNHIMQHGTVKFNDDELLLIVLRVFQGKPLNVVSEVFNIKDKGVEDILRNALRKIC